MVVREIHVGLWFLCVGLYFFLFLFILFFRYRKTRNPFQLAMSLFFLLLAVGRVFYFIADFYADPTSLYGGLPGLGISPLITNGGWLLSAGAFFQWSGLAVLSATAAFMIFGNRLAEILFAIPAFLIALVLAFVPMDSTIRMIFSGGAGILYALFIPLLFWYLAYQSGGVLRRSNALLGLGFMIMFAGQVVSAGRHFLASAVFGSYTIPGILAPGLIVISLILIAVANEWGQTQ